MRAMACPEGKVQRKDSVVRHGEPDARSTILAEMRHIQAAELRRDCSCVIEGIEIRQTDEIPKRRIFWKRAKRPVDD